MKITGLEVDLASGIISAESIEITEISSILNFLTDIDSFMKQEKHEDVEFDFMEQQRKDRLSILANLKIGDEIVVDMSHTNYHNDFVEPIIIAKLNMSKNKAYPDMCFLMKCTKSWDMSLLEFKSIMSKYEDNWFYTREEVEELYAEGRLILISFDKFIAKK